MPNIRDLAAYLTNIDTGVDPDSYSSTTITGDEIDAQNYAGGKAIFTVAVGNMNAGVTVDMKVQDCATSGGTFADIAGAAITQMTQVGGDNDTQAILEVAIVVGRPFLKVIMAAIGASDVCVTGFLYNARAK